MKLYPSKLLAFGFWGISLLLVEVNGFKGTVPLAKWQKWLESPQPITTGYWIDYKKSPEWHLEGLGESLIDLFKKVETTHPLLTSAEEVDEGVANRKPKDLVTLHIKIIDTVRAIRRAEEGLDEADILDTEANEFASVGESVRMLTGESLASRLPGNHFRPIRPADIPLEQAFGQDEDSEMSIVGFTQRSRNPISEVLDDSIIEKKLLDKIEGKRESIFREFEVQVDKIINTHVDLKIDVWGTRTGPHFKREIWVVIIDLYKSVFGRVPLRDPEALSFWLYNANSLSRDIEGKQVVKFGSLAKEDITIAFKTIVMTLDSMGQRLTKWFLNLEEALVKKEHIKLLKPHVRDLDLFIWAYRVKFDQLFKSVYKEIELSAIILY
ncbi:hypothetical protein TWF281_008991 [Arthrobotrys megalospora]